MAYNDVLAQQDRLRNARRVVSRLQTLLGGQNDFELPGIVVIGVQCVGKSALLESISGIRLPSNKDICTKCPLQLELHTGDTEAITVSYQHSPPESIASKEDIPRAIDRITKLLTGGEKKIVTSVITLQVTSPDAPNLTLLDLPGVQGDTPPGWPEGTKQTIEDLVISNCQCKHCRSATSGPYFCLHML